MSSVVRILPSESQPNRQTTTETVRYQHQPLSHRSIRVLRLQPAPRFESQLRCRLVPVSLDEKPQYWALSYTWGTDPPSLPIFCVDGPSIALLRITPNCASALRHLRDDQEERTLWVDGICIDQTSMEERSSQVALMGEIYRDAARVVVWLGESDGNSNQAISLLQQIGDVRSILGPMNNRQEQVDPATRATALQKVHANARDLTNAIDTDKDDFINSLFERPWFHRMWTVQEVTLPLAPKVDVFCGRSTINWVTLWQATDILAATGYNDNSMGPAMRLLRYISQSMTVHLVPGVRHFMRNIPDRKLDMELSLLLTLCRAKLVTDEKDKVYALYGLLDVLGIKLSQPDYQKSLADIFTEITTVAIEHDKSLWILCFAASDTRNADLPSWVPDWSDKGWAEDDPRHVPERKRFNAAGDSKPDWSFTSDPRELVLRGRIIDTVIDRRNCMPCFPRITLEELFLRRDEAGRCLVGDNLATIHEIYTAMRKWLELAYSSETYPTEESVDDVVKAILLNNDSTSLMSPKVDQFSDWLATMRADEVGITTKSIPFAMKWRATSPPDISVRGLLGAMFRPSKGFKMFEATISKTQEDVPIELRTYLAMASPGSGFGFHSLAVSFCAKKALFRTGGRYLGTAPDGFLDSLQIGDKIALVAGMEVPVILRRVGSGFKLVSHCYIHGIMDGDYGLKADEPLDSLLIV
ncbi:het-domain-containing protein [Fusarium heterosporum]|uniref:Het-domain-containing protein n=1 Tax=Fusarium heterosporum TaxID=42747 RepID=A0A8H5TCG1_FUSHE|nr:het-domain-containing protein [Fusarium heterosporum]